MNSYRHCGSYLTANLYAHIYVCVYILVPDVNGYVVEPTVLEELSDSIIKNAALGEQHSLFLIEKHLVSVGSNSHGQLGRIIEDSDCASTVLGMLI